MGSALSPAKVLLLAVHLAAHADIESLGQLSSQNPAVLRKVILLRVILTHLPETTRPATYVGFLREFAAGQPAQRAEVELDISPVRALSEQQAAKRAKKLHLLQLESPHAPVQGQGDDLGHFLFQRACRMDTETGMLSQLPDLLVPFLSHSPALRTWIVATVLPFVRRNSEYYAETTPAYSLLEFQKLPGPDAIDYLLARTGRGQADQGHIGRDLRGLIAPWLYDEARWAESPAQDDAGSDGYTPSTVVCLGWEQFAQWLICQATRSWKLTLGAFEQWDGPADVFFDHGVNLSISEPRQRYLDQSYARAALASAYVIQEASVDSLSDLYQMSIRLRSRLGHHGLGDLPLQDVLSSLPDMSIADAQNLATAKTAAYMRNDLLRPQNPLTTASAAATGLLMALILSAFISTRLGVPLTVKRAGDLAFLRDEREQRTAVTRLLRAVETNSPRDDDEFWARARREVLWLRGCCQQGPSSTRGAAGGIIATVPEQQIEVEILKALLSTSRYALARSLYEGGTKKPLPADVIQDAVFQSALNAFDNASNPNRTRGGLKKCDEIMDSFPVTVGKSLPGNKRIQALLRATHALSDYRLVLKRGEPFSPVVLRVHSDPISIIERVLEQNPKAYTRLQEFLEMGINMVRAGLPSRRSDQPQASAGSDQDTAMLVAERRIIAMSIDAALREDDFETAYSYVVSRLRASASDPCEDNDPHDEWSWQAALRAGQYILTERSQQPTHLGTASGNLEIRHMEQRIECLATALRVAPTCQLQEILKSFRRCEEQLDSAIKEEAANEVVWGAAGDLADLPGAFDAPVQERTYTPRNMTASTAARQTEEAPMSLFDLSRATASMAQRNFTALSSLQGVAASIVPANPEPDESAHQRVRKRDQLRNAATGTLVSGVGWLIGANVKQG